SPGNSAEPDDLAKLAAHISPAQLMHTVRELSNFDGRQSGTAGGQATAAYVASRLPEAALQPFPIATVQIEPLVRAEFRVDRRVEPCPGCGSPPPQRMSSCNPSAAPSGPFKRRWTGNSPYAPRTRERSCS